MVRKEQEKREQGGDEDNEASRGQRQRGQWHREQLLLDGGSCVWILAEHEVRDVGCSESARRRLG